MKGLFKLTVAAVALVGLASCNVDDLQSDSKQAPAVKGDILVEVEELEDAVTTRAAYTPNGKTGTLNFNTGDQIKVTDGTLVKYDLYKFNNGAFVFDKANTGRDAAWITEPEYASFPAAGMQWDNAKKQAIGTYTISDAPTWSEDPETEGAFGAEIPLWGTAQADATYGVKVSMKYLTGVLKINVDNIPDNASAIVVEGFKNLSGTDAAPMVGTFEAILANDDEINEDAFLDPATWTALISGGTPVAKNKITVDVSSAKKASSVIFIPLIAQKYGLLNIYYTPKGGGTDVLMKSVENLTVARKKYYNLTYSSLKVAGDKPSDITAAIEAKKGESNFSIETANVTTLVDETSAGAGDEDITIEVPECSSNITLNLAGVKGATTNKILKIKGEEFTGTLTVNVKSNDATTAVSNIYVDMPNANVVFTGAGMATIDLGGDGTDPNNVAGGMVAKTLTLGTADAPATFKGVYANAELGYYNTTGSDLLLVKGSTLKAIEFETNYKADLIEINGTLSSDLDMQTWKTKEGEKIVSSFLIGNGANTQDIYTYGDVTVTGGTVKNIVSDGNVNLSGVTDATAGTTAASVGSIYPLTAPAAKADAISKTVTVDEEAVVTGNVVAKTNHVFDLVVKGKGSVVGSASTSVNNLTINGTSANVGTIVVAGNATITDTDECEAITASLTMNEDKTLTMNGGYIKALTVNNNESAATKVLTIQHGTTAGYTAIGGITGTGSYKISGTSKWNGKAVGGGLDATKDAAKITALQKTYGDKAKTEIYTATELASIGTGAGTAASTVTLKSNIDLDGQAWTSPVLTATTAFTGANLGTAKAPVYPTIDKLNLAAAANTANGDITGVGLFKTAGGTISNLNISNVTSTITEANSKNVKYVGVIAGSTSADLTIDNVKVTTANVGATVADYIGGLVGYSGNNLTLTNVSVTGLTLNGQFHIGGVVGEMASAKGITITAGTGNGTSLAVTAINVPESFNAEPQITVLPEGDVKYGTVGMVIGKGKKDAITDNDNLTVNDLITGNRQKLGFKMCWYDAGEDLVYYYGQRGDDHTKKHTWIGRISGETGESAKKLTVKAFTDAYVAPTDVILVKHSIYDACDSEQ